MLLWWLIKFLHRCYYAFISEDHYFPRSFFQERGLRLEVKAMATRGAPHHACTDGDVRGAQGCHRKSSDRGVAVPSDAHEPHRGGAASVHRRAAEFIDGGACAGSSSLRLKIQGARVPLRLRLFTGRLELP